jgi:hypothetical protein
MTYSNHYLQNIMLRCHRMLVSGCLPYKDKCILNNVDYVQKKAVDDKIIEIGTICIKSKLTEAN